VQRLGSGIGSQGFITAAHGLQRDTQAFPAHRVLWARSAGELPVPAGIGHAPLLLKCPGQMHAELAALGRERHGTRQ
jgi:hypothetical protein